MSSRIDFPLLDQLASFASQFGKTDFHNSLDMIPEAEIVTTSDIQNISTRNLQQQFSKTDEINERRFDLAQRADPLLQGHFCLESAIAFKSLGESKKAQAAAELGINVVQGKDPILTAKLCLIMAYILRDEDGLENSLEIIQIAQSGLSLLQWQEPELQAELTLLLAYGYICSRNFKECLNILFRKRLPHQNVNVEAELQACLGTCYLRVGNLKEAERAIRQGLYLQPSEERVRAGLWALSATILDREGETDLALQCAQIGAQLKTPDPLIANYLQKRSQQQ